MNRCVWSLLLQCHGIVATYLSWYLQCFPTGCSGNGSPVHRTSVLCPIRRTKVMNYCISPFFLQSLGVSCVFTGLSLFYVLSEIQKSYELLSFLLPTVSQHKLVFTELSLFKVLSEGQTIYITVSFFFFQQFLGVSWSWRCYPCWLR